MMGWSSVVMASGQLMHHQMKIQQQNLSSKVSAPVSIRLPCHSLKQVGHHTNHRDAEHIQKTYASSDAHQKHDYPCLVSNEKDQGHHVQDSVVSHSNLNQQNHDASANHVQCNECTKSSCQTLNHVYVFNDHFDVSIQYSEFPISQNYFIDQTQNLRGFWQEILRPPKA